MSDILLDRIKAHRSAPDVYDAPTFNDMADRIEELEANALANRVAIMRLEAKLAKALELAEEAFDFNIEDAGPRAWHFINDRIEELKGQ